MQRKFNFILLIVVTLLLSACAATRIEMQKGQHYYYSGQYELSFFHVKKAAKAGDPDAQYALGYMYYYGKGAHQDNTLAMLWLRRAAMQGQPEAIQALHMISGVKTPVKPQAQQPMYISGGKPVVQHKPLTKPHKKYWVKKVKHVNKAKPTKAMHHAVTRHHYVLAHKPHQKSSSHNYTIQLLGSYKKADALAYIHRHAIRNKTSIYATHHNYKRWYVVIYGNYANVKAANSALHGLPQSLKSQHPWVKSMRRVRWEMKR